ncbi:MAG: LysM peptidoglycan-binding domain-containing protein [bacterium]
MAGQRKSLEWLLITFLCVFSAMTIHSIQTIEAEQVPSVYIVKEGDTLWDISKRYLENPFLWPGLWEMNKHIKDPQWIYPGQPLMLKEEKVSIPADDIVRTGHPAKVVKLTQPEQHLEQAAPPPLPADYLLNRDRIDSCGYILPKQELLIKEKQEEWGMIIDGPDSKVNYSYPDIIYINKGRNQVSPGALFTVFRSQDTVFHPQTNQELGVQIQILGIIEVKEVLDTISRAKIIKSFAEIHEQDRIKTYQQIPLPVRSKPKPKIQGMLIASEDGRLNLAIQDIVFLDQGKKQQIQAGNSFTIYRKDSIFDVSSEEKGLWPVSVDDVIGELLILKAEENTSTALITKSDDAIMVGYLFSVRP